jgi:Polyketide cyclase / dehydrase and lipid transport
VVRKVWCPSAARLDRLFTIRDTVPKEAAVFENSVEIHSSPEEVFDYCTDLAREHEWNPKLRGVEKLTGDPIAAGTRFRAEFLKGDPMTIEYVDFDRPRRWESVGRSRRLDARTYGHVAAIDTGARLTMRMELRPRGMPKFLLPLLALYMHRQQQRNLGSIKALLER